MVPDLAEEMSNLQAEENERVKIICEDQDESDVDIMSELPSLQTLHEKFRPVQHLAF